MRNFLSNFSFRCYSGSSSSVPHIRNAYKTLQLSTQTPTKAQVKSAYYALAKQHHPDTNASPSAHASFMQVQAAYDILKDDTRRSAHDRELNSTSYRSNRTYHYTSTRRTASTKAASESSHFDFEAHQYGHYGTPGARAREERVRAAERMVRREAHGQARENMRLFGSILFGAATLYVMFLSGWVGLVSK